MTNNFDVAVIGAGPAGLATIQALNNSGKRVALIDSGAAIQNRNRFLHEEMTHGHGGAGLFSDGKFSFFPSATALWELPNKDDLRAAYDWTCKTLEEKGLKTPPFPEDPTAYSIEKGAWVLKDYPSDYIPLDERLSLTQELVESSDAQIFERNLVEEVDYKPEEDNFSITLSPTHTTQKQKIVAKRIVFATGRFGPLNLLKTVANEHNFHRLEIGFRIEQPAQKAFFKNMKQLDPKLRFKEHDDLVEWRTFCACRNGETVLTNTLGLWTVSGHSDCPPTGFSNVGFNTRILNEDIAARTLPSVITAMADKNNHYRISLKAVINNEAVAIEHLSKIYGSELLSHMLAGVRKLAESFPEILDEETKLVGPTLEGIGWYPKLSPNLKLLDSPSWVIGDACGLFRGIVAAMISGHYVGSTLLQELE